MSELNKYEEKMGGEWWGEGEHESHTGEINGAATPSGKHS